MKSLSLTIASLFVLAPAAQAETVALFAAGLEADDAVARAEAGLERAVVSGGSVLEALGLNSGDVLAIGATMARCDQESERSARAELGMLRHTVDDMNYPAARQAVEGLSARLPCFAGAFESEELFDIYFLGGIAAFYDGKEALAQDFFGRAAALDPSRPWPKAYPPAPKATYLAGFTAALGSPPASLRWTAEGDVQLDGRPWTEEPTLYVGTHIVWLEALKLGFALDVPARSELPGGEVVLTTGADVEEGLLRGDPTFAPLLAEAASAQGWTSVALVSEQGVVEYRDGEFSIPPAVQAELDRAQREAAGPSPATRAGLGVAALGGGLLGGGAALFFTADEEARIRVGEPVKSADEYAALRTRNHAGLALMIAGGAAVTGGLVVAIVGQARKAETQARAPAVVPWFVASRDGAAFGVQGVLIP